MPGRQPLALAAVLAKQLSGVIIQRHWRQQAVVRGIERAKIIVANRPSSLSLNSNRPSWLWQGDNAILLHGVSFLVTSNITEDTPPPASATKFSYSPRKSAHGMTV